MPVSAEDNVVAAIATTEVVTVVADNDIVAALAKYDIAAGFAVELIVAAPGLEQIIAGPTEQRVGASAPDQQVVAAVARQRVVAFVANQDVALIAACGILDSRSGLVDSGGELPVGDGVTAERHAAIVEKYPGKETAGVPLGAGQVVLQHRRERAIKRGASEIADDALDLRRVCRLVERGLIEIDQDMIDTGIGDLVAASGVPNAVERQADRHAIVSAVEIACGADRIGKAIGRVAGVVRCRSIKVLERRHIERHGRDGIAVIESLQVLIEPAPLVRHYGVTIVIEDVVAAAGAG